MSAQDSHTVWGPLCALGSSVTWALAAAVYTQTASRIGALRTNLWRSALVFPLFAFFAVLLYGPRALLAVPQDQLGWLAMSTLCSYALGDLLYYMAALRLGTATALAIASIYPVWAATGGVLFLHETVGPSRILGTLCCIAGVVWLVMQQSAAPPPQKDAAQRAWILGVVLALGASFMWAGNAYSIRRGGASQPLMVVNALRYFMAVLALGGALLVQLHRAARTGTPHSARITSRFFFMVLLEAFGGSSIFVYGLSHSDLSVAAPLSSLAPLFSVPIGLYLGSEAMSWRKFLAIVITVSGVILLVR